MTELQGGGSGSDREQENREHRRKRFLFPEPPTPTVVASTSSQRLHNQSSTETSGLGETIASSFSSHESITSLKSWNSYKDLGIDLRENIEYIPLETFKDHGISNINNKECAINRHISAVPMKETFTGVTGIVNDPKDQLPELPLTIAPFATSSEPAADWLNAPTTSEGCRYNEGPDFDMLFSQSETLAVPQPSMGLQVDQINREWNSHSRSGSIISRASFGSFRSRSGSNRGSKKFLGRNTESKWTKWSNDRRASFRRRMELLDKPDTEVPDRPSTPIKKARQEGLKFVHPDLENKYISEDDINYIQRHQQQRLKTYSVIEKSKNVHLLQPVRDMQRLTVYEISIISRFWEHRLFSRTRYVSILMCFITIILLVISVVDTNWTTYTLLEPEFDRHSAQEGLWLLCQPVLIETDIEQICTIFDNSHTSRRTISNSIWESCLHNDNSSTQCLDTLPHWQNAVIGLMLFAALFGVIAGVLAVCGVCTSPLPRKIYYFHSSGEIFFVCALSTITALIIYPISIAMDDSIATYTYGSGYGTGWGGAVFFLLAALCMSLDDLVRESSQNKFCRYLCWKSNDRDNQQQV